MTCKPRRFHGRGNTAKSLSAPKAGSLAVGHYRLADHQVYEICWRVNGHEVEHSISRTSGFMVGRSVTGVVEMKVFKQIVADARAAAKSGSLSSAMEMSD